jgi:putative addiction module component (TIGR02574 family)
MSADHLRREALALPVDERAALAKDLLQSLDGDAEPGAEQSWVEELVRRAQAFQFPAPTLNHEFIDLVSS